MEVASLLSRAKFGQSSEEGYPFLRELLYLFSPPFKLARKLRKHFLSRVQYFSPHS